MNLVARISIKGGALLCAKNADRIIARSTKASDLYGNALDKNGRSPIYRFRDDPPYFQRWVIKKEKEGFIFREVTHGHGMAGHHRTVRALVIAALTGFSNLSGRMVVEFVEAAEERQVAA